MATPVLADLKAAVLEFERRMARCSQHALETRRSRLAAARLPRPVDLLGPASQRFDLAAGRLSAALGRNVALHERDFAGVAARLSPGLLDRPRRLKAERLAELAARLDTAAGRAATMAERRARLPDLAERMNAAMGRRIERETERLRRVEQLRVSLNPQRPLELGFALVQRPDGTLVHKGTSLKSGDGVSLKFLDETRSAVISDGAARPRPKSPPPPAGQSQGDLF
jgi:exodeoxyribonuclease VII large subunit